MGASRIVAATERASSPLVGAPGSAERPPAPSTVKASSPAPATEAGATPPAPPTEAARQPAPPTERTRSSVAVRPPARALDDIDAAELVPVHQVVKRPPRPIPLQLVALLLLALALVVAAAGLGGPDYVEGSGSSLTVNGAVVGDGAVELDLAEPVTVAGTLPAGAAPDAGVALELSALGIPLGSASTTAQASDGGSFTATLDATGSRYLVAGRATAEVIVRNGNETVDRRTFPVTSTQSPLLTAPGLAGIVLVLFVFGYAESLLRSRRRGRKAISATAGMLVIGALAGAAAVVAAWLAGGDEPARDPGGVRRAGGGCGLRRITRRRPQRQAAPLQGEGGLNVRNYRIEVREPGKEPAIHALAGEPVDVGRECEGLIVADPKASRRHVRLTPTDEGLTVVDLGSTNGTTLNGTALQLEATLAAGDVLQIGDTEIVLLAPVTEALPAVVQQPPAPAPATEAPTEPHAAAPQPPAVRPVLDELASRETDAAVIRYRPGSSGERAAGAMATAVKRARRRLAGLGSEPWGTKPQICLVDPFPDPDQPDQVMTSGTIVDAERAEVWMVVTAESPAEPPERPLALVFGSSLPAASDLGYLLEGYGLHVAGLPDPDPGLRGVELPALTTRPPTARSLPQRACRSSAISSSVGARTACAGSSPKPGRAGSMPRPTRSSAPRWPASRTGGASSWRRGSPRSAPASSSSWRAGT